MRKKLDTRFPAARIKKIMQADEDVGKIALAVPVLVSKALELFLQDLCDRTYDITLQRGAKTMSALHLKHCVRSYNVFDFLREIVSGVPDYGHGHSDHSGDHKTLQKRKPAGDECNDSDDESKRSRMHEMSHAAGSSGRGRGRGRGSGRGRASRNVEREPSHCEIESEPSASIQPCIKSNSNPGMAVDNHDLESKEPLKEDMTTCDGANASERNFDVNESEDTKAAAAASAAAAATASASVSVSAASTSTATTTAATSTLAAVDNPAVGPTNTDTNHEEYPGWSLSEMDKMAFDPLQLAKLGTRLDEEDYDEEG